MAVCSMSLSVIVSSPPFSPEMLTFFLASFLIRNPYQTWFSKRNQTESCFKNDAKKNENVRGICLVLKVCTFCRLLWGIQENLEIEKNWNCYLEMELNLFYTCNKKHVIVDKLKPGDNWSRTVGFFFILILNIKRPR